MKELARRIDRLEAESAIARLVHAYARAVRREETERFHELFLPTGTFELRSGHPDRTGYKVLQRFETPDALVAFLLEGKGKPHPVPLIHNLMIEVDGDTATASCMMAAPIYGTDREILGEYCDRLVRIEGRWLFSERIFTVYGD
jgi:hypothetical protein